MGLHLNSMDLMFIETCNAFHLQKTAIAEPGSADGVEAMSFPVRSTTGPAAIQPSPEKPPPIAMPSELATSPKQLAVDFLHGHHLTLQAPLGAYRRVLDGSVYCQTRVLAPPSGAIPPLLSKTHSDSAASPAKLLRKTLKSSGRPALPAAAARVRAAAPRRSILLSQAMALMRVEPGDIPAVLARLTTARLYLGEPPAPDDRIGATALEIARILARSTAGFNLIVTLCGPVLAGLGPSQRAAVRMKLQAQAALAEQADPAQARCARMALDAALARLATGELSSAQQVAWFDWTQHQRGRQPDILRRMQGTLHKFSTKTIHRYGPGDSVHNNLLRLSGKRLGPLRAATLADPTKMAEWHEDKNPAMESDAMRHIVRSIVLNLKHVSSVRLADGHVYGASTKQLSRLVASAVALSGTPLSAHVDLQASKARESFVEISRGQDGIRIFIGTSRKLSGHLTVGGTLGYEVTLPGVNVKAGASLALTPLSCEFTEPRGLVFRVARRMLPDGSDFDDGAMYSKALTLVDHLFSAAPGSDRLSPKSTWNRLATAFHDEPDISAGWISEQSTEYSTNISGSMGLTPRVLQCVVGPQISARATKRIGGSDSHHESGRRIAQERRTVEGHHLVLSASLGIQGSQKATEIPDALVGGASSGTSLSARAHQAALMLFALEIPLSSAISDHMRNGEMKLIEEDGELLAGVSMFDVEHKDPDAWEEAIRSQSTAWTQAFAESPGEAGLKAAGLRLSRYLAFAQENRRPHDSYILRYRLRADVAARINLGNAFAQGLHGEDDRESLQHIAAANRRLLSDPRSWIEAELKVRQYASQSRSSGFDLGAKLQRKQTLASEQDWSRLKPSPAALMMRETPAKPVT
jgi:hypothetical protein